MSMSFVQDELAEVKTKKTAFLEQMNRLVPWGKWIGIIEPYYYKRRARQQALRPGTDAVDTRASESV